MTEIEVLDKSIEMVLNEQSTFCCPTFAVVCFGPLVGAFKLAPDRLQDHPNWAVYQSVMERFSAMHKPPGAFPDTAWWPYNRRAPRIHAMEKCRDYFVTKYHEQTEA